MPVPALLGGNAERWESSRNFPSAGSQEVRTTEQSWVVAKAHQTDRAGGVAAGCRNGSSRVPVLPPSQSTSPTEEPEPSLPPRCFPGSWRPLVKAAEENLMKCKLQVSVERLQYRSLFGLVYVCKHTCSCSWSGVAFGRRKRSSPFKERAVKQRSEEKENPLFCGFTGLWRTDSEVF